MKKTAYMFVSAGVDPKIHRNSIMRPNGKELITIGVRNYAQGVEVAKELVKEGVVGISLCAGFGNYGVSMITSAVERKVPVGVVRFDYHPALEFKSGDEINF